jgi:hypothetical protein
VQCRTSGLDITDRQNAHCQYVSLRALFGFFSLAGRQNELYHKPVGFSFLYNDVDLRIWAHYVAETDSDDDDEPGFFRDPIAEYSFRKTAQADTRWIAWKSTMNILDLWVEEDYKWICSAIDMIPFDERELDIYE